MIYGRHIIFCHDDGKDYGCEREQMNVCNTGTKANCYAPVPIKVEP